MTRLTISCGSCGQIWAVADTFSLYEQLAIESRPCPRCGAYTLCCPEPTGPARTQAFHRARQRRPMAVHR